LNPASNWWIKTTRFEDNEIETTKFLRFESIHMNALNVVMQHLLADLEPDGGGMTDGELLARFLRSRDEDALAALIHRHAPMVWGVCRRLLDHHEAEDAFQATFLVLVRKAVDVPKEAVANWLHGVARQTAIRLRATAAKRACRERQVVNMPEPTVARVRDSDLQVVLDEELSRLPDHYWGVVVTCDLEGMTRKAAARQLGIPEGSVASRLARARALLAKRLTRRGIRLSGTALAATLSRNAASASAPALVVSNTIEVAILLAVGKAATGLISVKVAALTEGVVKAMSLMKIKTAGAALFLILGIAALGGGLFILQTEAAQWAKKGSGPIFAARTSPDPFFARVQVAFQAEEAQPADLPDKAAAPQPRLRVTIKDGNGAITSLGYSPDGKTLASGAYDNAVKLWDANTGKQRATLRGHTDAVLSVAFSRDGKMLASGSLDRTIKLWDVKSGKEVANLKGHEHWIASVAFSPDGKTLASGGDNVKSWDVRTGKEVAILEGHTNAVYSVAYSPDGKTLASGSKDRTIKLWDVKTGKERATLEGLTGGGSVVYSPDGKTLASGGANTLDFWDVKTGKKSARLDKLWDVATWGVDSVAYSPDGKTLALGSSTIKLWDVATGKVRLSLEERESYHHPTYALAYSPDGKTLASTGKDGTIKLWDVKPVLVKTRDVAANKVVSGRLLPVGAAFARVTGPGWLTIRRDGRFTGKPEEADSGVNSWVVSVTRGDNLPTFLQLQIKVIGTSIFVENFNSYRGTQNAVQWQSGLKVAHSGSVRGWTKAGENAIHAVDRANRAGQSNPENWAVMIFQDNVITSGPIAANASGQVYRVDFEASGAVYVATHPHQATQAGDKLLVEILRGDDRVLASHEHAPGAWTGTLQFAADSFKYTGDGSGDVRLRIKPAGPQTSGRFHGAIDNIVVRKVEAKK
jgi:RNA polymerase sigma factor (sigma-70 family)